MLKKIANAFSLKQKRKPSSSTSLKHRSHGREKFLLDEDRVKYSQANLSLR